jgi:glutathione S-transferase
MKILVWLFLPLSSMGLAFNNNPVSDMLNKVTGGSSSSSSSTQSSPAALPSKADGDRLLKTLNLKASTEPKMLSARTQQIPNLLTASIPLVLRAGSGALAQDYNIQFVPKDDNKYSFFKFNNQQSYETGVYKVPNEPLILYEFEACPFCKMVREACSILSLPVTIRPCPKDGRKYRKEIKDKFGTKATFPYLIDNNTGASMFESRDIINYLFKVYGNGSVPASLADSPIVPLTAGLGVGLARLGAGGQYRNSNPPSRGLPIVLWAYEGSPFCKVVRETLSSLELPHTIYYSPRGSQNRQILFERVGTFQVPFLQDPNTGVELFESEAIVEYLEAVYAVVDSPVSFL